MKTPIRLVLYMPAVSLLSAANPFVGVWKLNSTQSRFATDPPGVFFTTMQIESAGGTPCKVLQAANPTSASAADTITLTVTGSKTILATGTRNGEPVYFERWVVSHDGTTMTVVRDGATVEQKKYNSTIILERSL